jgi:hypothetical protein
LVGQWFHSLSPMDNQIQWQGTVLGNPEPGWYLVQIFNWVDDLPSVRHLVRTEDMRGWLLYPNAAAMRESYDHGTARAGGKYRAH